MKHYVVPAVLLVVGVLFFLLDPAQQSLMPKCPFKLLTGLDCPSCGFQRALHAALHGRLAEAVGYNWLLVLSLPYAAALVAAHWLVPFAWRQPWLHVLEHRYAIWTYVILVLAWWVVRNWLGV